MQRARKWKHERKEDFPPYVCKKHGLDENPIVYPTKRGYLHRRCRACYRICQRPPNLRWQNANRIKVRREVLAVYGDACECCGESNQGFLSIDHVNNDGAKHRAEVGLGSSIYLWLKREGFPKDGRFRILCFSCNLGRARNGGVCPHKSQPGEP